MITEDYVSFETAKLLKEKGFNESTSVNYYVGDGKPRSCVVGEMIYRKRYEKDTYLIACPTLQMVMKWLREKEIFPEVTYTLFSSPHKYQYSVFRIEPEFYTTSNWYKSYEEAAEAAIRYCLENLI